MELDGGEERPTREFAGWARWGGTSLATAWVSGALAARTGPGDRSGHETLHLLQSRAAGSGDDSNGIRLAR